MGTLLKLALVAVFMASALVAQVPESDDDDGDGGIEVETAVALELHSQSTAKL